MRPVAQSRGAATHPHHSKERFGYCRKTAVGIHSAKPPNERMYFGVDYHPEHWVYPYAGTPEQPESRWERDAELMAQAGMNVVRMGEFTWGLCEREEGKYDFAWLRRAMDIMEQRGIKVVLATPTA